MKVKDVMGSVAVAVRPETSFIEVVDAMRRFEVGAVTVVDADGRPIGVVSEDDLLLKETELRMHAGAVFAGRRKREERRKAAGTTAGEIMTAPAITVTRGTPVRDAARMMRRHRIKQLPVIDAVTGRLVGAVRRSDLLKVFVRPATEIDREVTALCDRLGVDRSELATRVEEGVLTLSGRVGLHSQSSLLVAAVRGIDGVLDVENHLTHRCDDLARVQPLVSVTSMTEVEP
ncbi:CBS domain-containing protein [Streptosporangium becharense]|uniref:CBS domain-containing protein n=1 Tax=Streptosporangium becharense TaxID=1816182 RepID=A0A7W9ME23_9ACTN|nr:CBS domain-containing protein [Streptosporangium becharense]MBB2910817.1 CBS domain-containing protein [Streptosporangium becharense]MBB5817512.1 CBS domain-containing protein [Streptosporangium becharense]